MKALKTFVLALLSLVTLTLTALVVVPVFLNIDQYRPELVNAVNGHLNGEFAVKKLSLSLWGQIAIAIDGAQLKDSNGHEVLSVDHAAIELPFSSLLQGAPQLTLALEQPKIAVVRDRYGVMNLAQIIKTMAQAGPSNQQEAEPKASAEPLAAANTTEAPLAEKIVNFIRAAQVDVDLKQATLDYRDLSSDFSQSIDHLDFSLHDLSMTHPMQLGLAATVSTDTKALSIKGPLSLKGTVTPSFDALAFQGLKLQSELDADGLSVSVPQLFHKESGLKTRVTLNADLSPDSLKVEELNLSFLNATIKATAEMTELKAVAPQSPKLSFVLSSNPIDLSAWTPLLPIVKDLRPEGVLELAAASRGALNQPDYEAQVKVKKFSVALPEMAVRPEANLELNLVTNEVKALKLDVNAPDNHLNMLMNVKNFKAPAIKLAIQSDGMNLDRILPPPPANAVTENTAAPGAVNDSKSQTQNSYNEKVDADSQKGLSSPKASTDFDAMVAGLVAQPMIKNINLDLDLDIARLNARGLSLSKLKSHLSIHNLEAQLEKLDAGIWGGFVHSEARLDLKPKHPNYSFKMNIAQLDTQAAVKSQFEALKSTAIGLLSATVEGKGESLNPDAILKNLEAKGNLTLRDAKFSTVDISQMALDALVNGLSLNNIAVAELGGSKVAEALKLEADKFKTKASRASRYQSIGGSFHLKDGVFALPDFKAVAQPREGIDLVGATELRLLDDSLSAHWEVVDTYDWTTARAVSLKVTGQEIPAILADGAKPVSFPVAVGCKISAPCFDYQALPKHFAAMVGKNIKAKVANLAHSALEQQQAALAAEKQRLAKELEAKLEAEKAKGAELEAKAKQAAQEQLKANIKKLRF